MLSEIEELENILGSTGVTAGGHRRYRALSPAIARASAAREPAIRPASDLTGDDHPTIEDQPPQPPAFFAEVVDYDGLRDAIRSRAEQLNVSRACIDEIAGLPSGYAGKLLSQGRPKDIKRIGSLSLSLLLPALGLKLIIVDDLKALAKVEAQFVKRNIGSVRLGNDSRRSKGRRSPKRR